MRGSRQSEGRCSSVTPGRPCDTLARRAHDLAAGELIEVERVAKRQQVVTEHLQQQQWREIEQETAAAAKAKAAAAEAGASGVAEGGAVGEEAADGARPRWRAARRQPEAAAAFVAQGDLAALGALGVAGCGGGRPWA